MDKRAMFKQAKGFVACIAVAGIVVTFTGCCLLPPRADRPVILCQPQSQVVPIGTNVTFTVSAEKLPPYQWQPLTYQWQVNKTPLIGLHSTNWSDLGTNSNTLTIANAQKSDVGSYRAKVTGSGTVTSDAASLEVYSTTGGQITLYGPPVATSG